MAEIVRFEVYSEKYPGIRRRDIVEKLVLATTAHTTLPIIKQVNVQVPASLSVASTGVGLQRTNVQLSISLNTLSTGIGPPRVSVGLPVQVTAVSTGFTVTELKITQGSLLPDFATSMNGFVPYISPSMFPFVPPVTICPDIVVGADLISTGAIIITGGSLVCQSGGAWVYTSLAKVPIGLNVKATPPALYMPTFNITTGLNLQTSTSATT